MAGKQWFIPYAPVLHKCYFWDLELTECFVSCYSCLSPCSFTWFLTLWTHFKKYFIYLFILESRREGEWERNVIVWLPLEHPHWGPGLQPRHVSWLGIKPVTLWFAGRCSIHWSTPARAHFVFLTSSWPPIFDFLCSLIHQGGEVERAAWTCHASSGESCASPTEMKGLALLPWPLQVTQLRGFSGWPQIKS